MANKRQRNRAIKRRRKIDTSELQPRVAAGLAQGREEIEAADLAFASSPRSPSGVEMLRRWESEQGKSERVPHPKFVGESRATGFVRQRPDGSKLADTVLSFPPDVMRAIREGMICLRCLEPQPYAFADQHIEGCEGVMLHGQSYMKDRQVMDIAMEFEGEKHFGPSMAMQQFLDAQDERVQKRKFIVRILEGGTGRIPKEWLKDDDLMRGLHPSELAMLQRSLV